MATYFHGNPDFQAAAASAEGLQTLVLMNPTYVQYSNIPPPPPSNNLVFLNAAASAASNSLSATHHLSCHAPSNTQQFVGIPLDPNSHDASTLHGLMPRIHYNLYNPIDPPSHARETPRAQQGLSLSLSSQQKGCFGSQVQSVSGEDIRVSGGSVSSGSGVTNGVLGMQGVLLSSKYLKAAQELLDEVVSVSNNDIKSELSKKSNGLSSNTSNKVVGGSLSGEGYGGGEVSEKRGPELSTAERQEIQMKKAKLISMLDEVEQRYRQYHHQMQIVISSFEHVAGIGSAKTYTALALKTISKQFRCLKDAITGQIKASNKSLGEEDCLGEKIEGSRLKFVDHHLRQQRALQQLGMIQQNAWRPQRGLPERSVSVLRAWLFEHFLHPYPKDSDKHMLAKQTGLTRSQVSNWFINARVRLWKPMVEEMYTEEIKEQEQDGSEDKTSKNDHNEDSASRSVLQEKGSGGENQTRSFKSLNNSPDAPSAISMPTASTSPVGGNVRNQPGFSFIGTSELEGITQRSPKKPRSNDLIQSSTSVPSINMDIKPGEENNEHVSLKFGSERQSKDGYSFMGGQTNFIGGFGQYPIGEIGRFDGEQFTPRFSGNGVSLSLGLPHCENLSLSGTHQTFLRNQDIQLGRRVEIGEPNEFGAINTSSLFNCI